MRPMPVHGDQAMKRKASCVKWEEIFPGDMMLWYMVDAPYKPYSITLIVARTSSYLYEMPLYTFNDLCSYGGKIWWIEMLPFANRNKIMNSVLIRPNKVISRESTVQER